MSDYAWGEWAASIPWTLLAVVITLGVTFVVALRQHRHSVVDITWGLGFVVVAATTWWLSAGTGDVSRRALLLTLTGVWGVRLALHIGWRSRGKGEDPRYDELLRRKGGNRTLAALRSIYLTQGAVLWFVSLPVQVAMFAEDALGPVAWVGVLVWLVGFFFEAVGDAQLAAFGADPANRGRVLDTGLWRYTRHPNYFGDAFLWWGLFLISADAWPGVLTVLSPVLMTYLLAKGTGKPLLEKDIGSRRPGYKEYVERTSGFVPLPPRRTG